MMSKYQEDLDKLFNFATHNDNGQKGVNDYVLEELRQSKLNLEELVHKATPLPRIEPKDRFFLWACPNCETDFIDSENDNYCPVCGQRLKND